MSSLIWVHIVCDIVYDNIANNMDPGYIREAITMSFDQTAQEQSDMDAYSVFCQGYIFEAFDT